MDYDLKREGSDLLASFSDFRRYVRADAESKGVPISVRSFFWDPIFRFTVYLRLNEWLVNANVSFALRVLPLVLFRRLGVRLGFSVPVNVFGPGLAIVHYGLLVVSPDARVGKNCRVHAAVNIGGAVGLASSASEAMPGPRIGDDCYIGPGAKIYGTIRIGDGCVIGANSVVNKSFERSFVTLAGAPARVVREKGSEGMIRRGA